MIYQRIKKAISSGLFPETCFCCNDFIETTEISGKYNDPLHKTSWKYESGERIFETIMGPLLCGMCMDGFVPIVPPACTKCGVQFAGRSGDDHLCGRCITLCRPFVFARACGQYAGVLMKLVHAYKYKGKTGLGRPFGRLLYLNFLKYFSDVPIDFVTCVPLHRQKLIRRGFDQVACMLYYWPWSKSNTKLLPQTGSRLCENLLIRVKNTETQTGLSRDKRKKNIKNAFKVTDALLVKNKSVLLTDDVYTTGATLEECAFALKRAGASQVYLLSLARAM